jgi:hypothetical protein
LVAVRIVVRDNSINGCAKQVSRKNREGWEPITKIKIDDSMAAYGEIQYVCVMEMPDKPGMVAKRKKDRFNSSSVGRLD